MNELKPIDFDKELTLSREEIRNWIAKFEEILRGLPQVEIPCEHYFGKDVYGRHIQIKKGETIVGKIHRHATINVISSGEVSVLSIDGKMRLKAPHVFVSSPGAKRVIFAHEDSTWTCFHGTKLTDVAEIENEFIAKSYDDICHVGDREVTEEVDVCHG